MMSQHVCDALTAFKKSIIKMQNPRNSRMAMIEKRSLCFDTAFLIVLAEKSELNWQKIRSSVILDKLSNNA